MGQLILKYRSKDTKKYPVIPRIQEVPELIRRSDADLGEDTIYKDNRREHPAPQKSKPVFDY